MSENNIDQFEDIRPLNESEVEAAVEELIVSDKFQYAIRCIAKDIDWDEFSEVMRQCKTKVQFKSHIGSMGVQAIAKYSTFSLTSSGRSRLPKNTPCTFISNHRDIVLDAAFLNYLLYDIGHGLTQVAIGDNLLLYPWIKTIVRLNNCFIVKRNVPRRQMLDASKELSAYIHHTIKETKESIWIAQREGRAKDGNDKTQPSILKMLNMGCETSDLLSNIISLNIVPVALSYEIDPCDYLKAKEFQQKRDNPEFVKGKQDDLLSMETGLLQYKGRVHFTFGSPINPQLELMDPKMEKNELVGKIAHVIDKEIYKHYRFYPFNYVAYDMLHQTMQFRSNYDQRDKKQFEDYIQKQLNKIELPNKDELFLRTKLLEMYSNPLKNHLENK